MSDVYMTLERPAEGVYREKGSRFLAFGFPIGNLDEVAWYLDSIRKKYHDARHHCYAFRYGPDASQFRMSDDGEPSGTAGKPIFNQLVQHNLTNTLCIVVRYFGGVLLGTGGLVRSYRSAAAGMIANASIITRHRQSRLRILFDPGMTGAVMRILHESGTTPCSQNYSGDLACCDAWVRQSHIPALSHRLLALKGTVLEAIPDMNDEMG